MPITWMNFKNLIKSLVLIVIAFIFSFLLYNLTSSRTNITIVFIFAVVLVSRVTSGYIWGAITSVIGIIGINFFFTYPYFKLDFTQEGYPLTFISMLAMSLIVSTMTAHMKRQNELSNEQEKMMEELNEVGKDLLRANSLEEILTLTLDIVLKLTQSSSIFYEKDPLEKQHALVNRIEAEASAPFFAPHEQETAHLAYIYKTQTGLGTKTPRNSSCLYLPLISHDKLWGILGIYSPSNTPFEQSTMAFLSLMLSQVAMAIERQSLSDKHHQIAMEAETEKMRANLLRAVSHDLRTPLTGMLGAANTYLEAKAHLSESEKDELINNIREDTNWLLHMVENLLSVTRISEDRISVLRKTPEVLEEVIAAAISRVKKRYPHIALHVVAPDEFLMVPMDATLIEQVIINLIENAFKHAQSKKPIELVVSQDTNQVLFKVIDYGIGLADPNQKNANLLKDLHVHQPDQSSKGMGIGLSICETIVHAHGGTMTAYNHDEGAIFTFTLPLEGGTTTYE